MKAVVGIAVLAALTAAVAAQLPELKRYMKMKRM
jgi:hypothetical protein